MMRNRRYIIQGVSERNQILHDQEMELLQVLDKEVDGLQLLARACKASYRRAEEHKKNLPDIDEILARFS